MSRLLPDTHGDLWPERQPGSKRARWVAVCDHCPWKLDDTSVVYGQDALDALTRHVARAHGHTVPPTGPAWSTDPIINPALAHRRPT